MFFLVFVVSFVYYVFVEKSYFWVGIGNVLWRSGRGEDFVFVEVDDIVYNRCCGGIGVVFEMVFLNLSFECRLVLKFCFLRSYFDGKLGFGKRG